ncbi:MAG TPA: alpha/beta family hydrolase [Acidobacteriaceae bacterium]
MNSYEEFLDLLPDEIPVRGYLHRPPGPIGDCLILTHGAGSNCDAPLLVALSDVFCATGLTVLRCDLPFRQLRPHGPPPRGSAERDQQGLRAAIASMRRRNAGRLFLGGHSYGGRQASMLSAADPKLVDRLLLLSYPLHPPRRPSEMRTGHFPDLKTPALFVHGTRDGFGSLDEMTAALKLIPAPTALLPITGGGHELVTKKNRDEVSNMVVEAFQSFANDAVI